MTETQKMDVILENLESLDNVQLRAELLKQGEKVGPVTPTTRKLFLSRLAQKLYKSQNPNGDTAEDHNESEESVKPCEKSVQRISSSPFYSATTGRKNSNDSCSEKEGSCMYYVVILAEAVGSGSTSLSSADYRVFTERLEALAFMKINNGARLKLFRSSTDFKHFLAHSDKKLPDEIKGNKSIVSLLEVAMEYLLIKDDDHTRNSLGFEAEKSAFRGPKVQELVHFRKLIEAGDLEMVKNMMWSNPRYLISGADTPVILHEGMRHNALHISAKANKAAIALLILETIQDPEFTGLLYSCSRDTAQSKHQRILYLTDLYLNSPDKGSAETPLHIACKMGHVAVVQTLVAYSVTDRSRQNKYGERPEEIICSRYKGDKCAALKEEIQELLKGLCLVPLLRSRDNITLPVVGEPCSPDDKLHLTKLRTPERAHSPKERKLTLSAFAGPMSPNKARDFQRQWINPRCLRNTFGQEIASAKRGDAEKGYERIGRKLAKELHVPWSEYWQFLDAFADFSTPDGLKKLEEHLTGQTALTAIQAAMQSAPSSEDSSDCSSQSSGDDCQQDTYYSCDEELDSSAGESSHRRAEAKVDDEEADIFEDSLESFFEARSFVFGQRLQLKRSAAGSNQEESTGKGGKGFDISTRDESRISKKDEGLFGPWTYREESSFNEQRVSEASQSSDITHSFDASDAASVSGAEDGDTCAHAGRTKSETLDKSFNTVMSELSEDFDTKLLIFSPDGKVIASQKGRGKIVPDIGLCIGQKVFPKTRCALMKRQCCLDVLIKSRKAGVENGLLADVLTYLPNSNMDIDSDEEEEKEVKQKVVSDVTVVMRNAAVLQHVWRLRQPVQLTVGILELEGHGVADSYGTVRARVVRRHRHRTQTVQTFICGNEPCKTDLDVMRAMCDTTVEPSLYPAVHSWLQLVTATQQGQDSWPSPSRLRHQQRLEDLHTNEGRQFPISPLVKGGLWTSTPVAWQPVTPVRTHRNVSPDGTPTISTPRAWLTFKSPT